MLNSNRIPILYTSILYLCGFFLFLEWLYPLQIISDKSNVTVFIMYAALCFAISVFRLPWWASFLLKGFGVVMILHALFLTEKLFSKLWFNEVSVELVFNIQAIFSNQMGEITSFFRTLLFLLIIWVMSYLVHYWFVVMKRIFVFLFFTFLYLALLDTFTMYEGFVPIVRTFIISFIALGVAHYFKEIDREKIDFPWFGKLKVWLVPIIGMTFLASAIGIITPSFAPQWPDPVPFFKSATNFGNDGDGQGTRRVGYGSNDSNLGGSFQQDYTPVFQATTANRQYWRVETKDVYTGKGWERSADLAYEEQANGEINLDFYAGSVQTEEETAYVRFNGKNTMNNLVYPYGMKGVQAIEGVVFSRDPNANMVRAQIRDESVQLQEYSMTFDEPVYSLEALRAVTAGNDPENIMENYTRVPDTLPDRVRELAEEITADTDNRYDQAKAVEQYFNQNGFEYVIEDVPYPEEDQDYVDQFLFETQIGYCDNYSTSMVVMLRTLNIPARWAKGFTGGEEQRVNEDGMRDFEVTNANAHSWVEVYFPNEGWVPFEPTQGFDNPSTFRNTNLDQPEVDLPETDDTEVETPEPEEDEMMPPEMEDLGPTNEAGEGEEVEPNRTGLYVTIGVIFLLILAFIIYKTRFRWKTIWVYRKWMQDPTEKNFTESYLFLLTLLGHYTLARRPEQTLREYAEQIDERYHTKNMSLLNQIYEQILYNNEGNDLQTKEFIPIWKELVDQMRKE